MAALMTPRFVVTEEETRHVNEGTCDQIPRDQKERIFAMLPATLRFRVDLRPFLTLVRGDLFVKLAASRGDDMCYIFLFPAHNLWKYQSSSQSSRRGGRGDFEEVWHLCPFF